MVKGIANNYKVSYTNESGKRGSVSVWANTSRDAINFVKKRTNFKNITARKTKRKNML